MPLTPARLGAHSRSAVLTAAVRDLDDEVDAQVRVVVPILAALTAALLAVVATTILYAPSGLVAAGVVTSMALSGIVTLRRERPSQRSGLAARAQAGTVAALVTTNALDLQAIGAQESATDWLGAAHRQVRGAAARQGALRAAGLAWQQATTLVSTLAMVLVVAPQVNVAVSAPVAALLVLVPVALADASATLPDAIGAWARAEGARERLHALLAQKPAVAGQSSVRTDAETPEPETAQPAGPASLELVAVQARWAPHRAPTDPVDLSVLRGEHLALTGPNGCGKSTALAVLARALDPTSGAYLIDDVDALAQPVEQVRSGFAIVDDEPHVFASTVRENLRLARPDAQDAAIGAALRTAGLSDWVDALADGLDTRLVPGGCSLSGGERTRLALARAVLSRRPVLLLDEPVAHLDHATALAVLTDLSLAWADHTVVMVSHRPDGLSGFDRVVELDAHRLVRASMT